MAAALTYGNKLFYGVGDIGLGPTSTILGAYFIILMIELIGFKPEIATIAIFVGCSWDYRNDPNRRISFRQNPEPLGTALAVFVFRCG